MYKSENGQMLPVHVRVMIDDVVMYDIKESHNECIVCSGY